MQFGAPFALGSCVSSKTVRYDQALLQSAMMRTLYKDPLVMQSTTQQHIDLVIVDAYPEHYHALLHALDRKTAHHSFADGHSALASLPRFLSAGWLINMQLPDFSGAELLRLIRDRRPGTRVALVADVYSTADELAARAAGATAFLCKPANVRWIHECRWQASPCSLHAGPMRAPN